MRADRPAEQHQLWVDDRGNRADRPHDRVDQDLDPPTVGLAGGGDGRTAARWEPELTVAV
jgi:hypothetical protein